MNKKCAYIICSLLLSVIFAGHSFAQKYSGYESYRPVLAVKTNALYWGATTPNLGVEVGLGRRSTMNIDGAYNPWTFSDNKKLKLWLVQPEFRLWTCERFGGHFFGIHAHYAEYNVGGIRALGLDRYRYEGHLYGGGVSYGYQWFLGNRWNLEATVGVGYARLEYDKYECHNCGQFLGREKKNYFGPTKVGVSFIFLIK